ncbi:HPr(Ser) kinase/phosphatase, partial [candidate division GN15 bacterium]|nr:HPr(Ser) kinase/phosphatase [candidate division GN15 bacterium]
MASITVEKLFDARKRDLELTPLSGRDAGLGKEVKNPELHRPGLALTGFYERFPSTRIQILGETELAYLNQLPRQHLQQVSEAIFSRDIPVAFISKGITPPLEFLQAAERSGTAVFSSRLTTAELVGRLSAYLDHIFAPTINVHGTLVDVYGVGLL